MNSKDNERIAEIYDDNVIAEKFGLVIHEQSLSLIFLA